MTMKLGPLRDSVRKSLDAADISEIVADQSAVISGEKNGVRYVGILGVRKDDEAVAVVFRSLHDVEVYAHGLIDAAKATFESNDGPEFDA